MGLGWPFALVGLAALALPLAVHLLHRGRSRRIPLATARFLGAPRPPSWRRLALRDPWLLAARVAVVVLATLVLAEAFVQRAPRGGAEHWLLVSPRLDGGQASNAASGEAPAAGFAREVWLAPGFPALDAPRPLAANVASLVAEADANAPPGVTLHVAVAADAADIAPRRPALSERVRVQTLPATIEPSSFALPARIGVTHDGSQEAAAAAAWLGDIVARWRGAGVPIRVDAAPAGNPPPQWFAHFAVPPPDGATTTVTFDDDAPDARPAQGAVDAPWLRERRTAAGRVLLVPRDIAQRALRPERAAAQLLDALIGAPAHWPSPDHPVTAAQWRGAAASVAPPAGRRAPLAALTWLLVFAFVAERGLSARRDARGAGV